MLDDARVLAAAIYDIVVDRGCFGWKHLGRNHRRLVNEAGGTRVLAGLVLPGFLDDVNTALRERDPGLRVVWTWTGLIVRREEGH